jgi:hypothetical protein
MNTFFTTRRWAVAAAVAAVLGGMNSSSLQAAEAADSPAKVKTGATSRAKPAKQPARQYSLNRPAQEVKVCMAECAQDLNAPTAQGLGKLERDKARAKTRQTQPGWTLSNNQLFAIGDAPSRLDWGTSP